MSAIIPKLLLGCILALLLNCASGTQSVSEAPQEGKSLLVGAVLLENNGIEDVYESKRDKITVVIVGKSTLNGEEKVQGYRAKTDKDGYFMLQNVPPGAYVMKGIEADIGYETRLLLTSRWEGNQQIFLPIETIIDHTVRVWPEPSEEKIIDMQICYFGVDAAYRVYHDTYPMLNDNKLMLKDQLQTMENPKTYYREKYPQWFQGESQ